MAVPNFVLLTLDKLFEHLDHTIEIADYTVGGGKIASLSIECLDCDEIIVEVDNPELKD